MNGLEGFAESQRAVLFTVDQPNLFLGTFDCVEVFHELGMISVPREGIHNLDLGAEFILLAEDFLGQQVKGAQC